MNIQPEGIQMKQEEDYEPVFSNEALAHFDFEQLARKNAFQEKCDQKPIEEDVQEKKPFFDTADIWPFTIASEQVRASMQGVDWMNLDQQREFLSKVESIKARNCSFTKPIAIIINPNSGKKIDLMPIIQQRLEQENIPFEWFPTAKAFDSFLLSYNLDSDKYSAIVSCGGDGTYHEVMNGMMARPDGKRLPIAVVPNGSGNDTAHSVGVVDVETALNTLIRGQVIKTDTYRVMTDKENAEVPEGEEAFQYRRYCHDCVLFGMIPAIGQAAIPWKPCCGNTAYTIAAMQVAMCQSQIDSFKLEIDGKVLEDNGKQTVDTSLFGFSHTKWMATAVY